MRQRALPAFEEPTALLLSSYYIPEEKAFIKRLVKKDKSCGYRGDFRLAAAYGRKAGGI